MAFSFFFNLFRYSIQARFKKRVTSFFECCFNFLFLFDEELNGEWNASVWFDDFFWKMVVNFDDYVCENVKCIVNDFDRIWIFGINQITNLVLKIS